MRTRELLKYLAVMIMALNTSVNVFAQQRNLKIYFDEYASGSTAPKMYVTDDNDKYGIPLGVTVKSEGVAWAGKSRFFEWIEQDVTDRIMADYVSANDKKNSKLKLEFTKFPYEINSIQWNAMNDLLSGSLSQFFKNYNVTTTCVPVSGDGFSYKEENWSMNFFAHQTSFSQSDIPWKSGTTLNGLKSFEISEYYENKLGFFNWTIIDFGKSELSDKVRTFIKASWNGSETDPKVITRNAFGNQTGEVDIEDDEDNWAFNVKFTLPDIRARIYSNLGNENSLDLGQDPQEDSYVYKGEIGVHALQGYISAHQGAVEPTYDPTDQSDFHFEYFADKTKMVIGQYTGIIKNAKVAGEIPVTVKLMRANREVCSYVQEVIVSEVIAAAQKAEISVGFVDGKKGYDIMVGEKNAQIKGFITKYGKDANGDDIEVHPNENTSGYHFEYSEASNGEIITIDPLTGDITPKKEGDVQITAVLKYGNNIYSDPFTYTLHVFGKYEGVDVTKKVGLDSTDELIYHYSTNETGWFFGSYDVNPENWKASENYLSSYNSYDWKPTTYLKPSTSIQENSGSQSGAGTDGWKQFAWYKTSSAQYWRAIAQKICFDIKIPKYTTMSVTYSFAGNLNTGTGNGTGCQYGFEVLDLGNIKNTEITNSNNRFNGITWNTTSTGENIKSASAYTSLAQKAISQNGGYVGDGCKNIKWTYNITTNSDFGTPRYYTHYLAVMAYLYRDGSYPGEFSVGYKGIPTYTYYTAIAYYKNDGTGTIVRDSTGIGYYKTTSKTQTVKLLRNKTTDEENMLKREGYTFLGWSTDPNATTPEYAKQDNFLIYDNVNGGGRGLVKLYAVWKPNNYIVTLHKNDGGEDETGQITVTYNEPMPENIGLVVPTRKGYDFTGYHNASTGSGKYYYNANLESVRPYDKPGDSDLYARWKAHNTTIHFDFNGGSYYTNDVTVVATYGKAMPTSGDAAPLGVPVPTREGYTFTGYYYVNPETEKKTTYYNYGEDENNQWVISSARNWNIDERTLDPQVTEVTLYANWTAKTYTVILDPQGGEGGSTSVIATYGEPLPSGLTAPTKPGYDFKGYYDNQNQEWAESIEQDYGGKKYYDNDMVGVENWKNAYDNVTIYAHWAPATYIVTLDANGGVLPISVIDNNKGNFDIAIPEGSNGIITITYKYKAGKSNTLVSAETKKPGYELLGWFDSNGVKVIEANEKSRNCTITDNGGYWTEGGLKYNHIGNITLTAQYRKKYKYADNVITFGKDDNGNPEKVEPDEDWLYSVVNDLVGAAKDVYDNEKGHPQTMVFDLRESVNRWTSGEYDCQHVMEDLQAAMQNPEYSACISPNVLVYFNEKSYYADKCNNAILSDFTCPNLYVTDRYQMKILYEFKAGKALYERNKLQINTDDPMWQQSYASMWGTLCLPYPIKNYNTHYIKDEYGNSTGFDCKVIFYELRRKSGNVMQFYKLPEDAVIPANTPVLYERTEGVSSAVSIEEVSEDIYTPSIIVPENLNFEAATKTYSKAVLNTDYDWQFIGNMKETIFYGKNYTKVSKDLRETKDNVYYIKKDNFTRLSDTNYMTLYPYRAYFREVDGANSDAKLASFSILVIDEEGATDITNAILGEGEGDGKIYDLNGVRVKQPVKGRLYIVNGKKKVYE